MKNAKSVNIGFHSAIRFPANVLGSLMSELYGVCTVQTISMIADSPVANSEYIADIDVSGDNLATFTAVLAEFPTATLNHITLNKEYSALSNPSAANFDESKFTSSENTLIKILLGGWVTVEKINKKTGWAASGIHARFTGLRNNGVHIEKMKNGTENSQYRIVSLVNSFA